MNLPTELLRSLVAIADAGSLARAGERVLRTPSALSLQMAKLEQLLDLKLFERRGRRLVLTSAGELLLLHAREILDRHDAVVRSLKGATEAGRVRLGMVQDFVEPMLSDLLARLRAAHPLAQIEVIVAGSAELREGVRSGELDLVIAARGDSLEAPVRVEPMVWIGQRRLAALDEIPLVLVTRPCPFAEAALRALEAAGRRYRISLQTPSLSGARAAIQAGLGIGCRTRLFAGAALEVLGGAEGLPALPCVEYVLLAGRQSSPAAATTAGLIEEMFRVLPN